MKPILLTLTILAISLSAAPAQAGPLRKAARGVGAVGRFLKNHIPHPFRRCG